MKYLILFLFSLLLRLTLNGQELSTDRFIMLHPVGGNVQELTVGVGYGKYVRQNIIGNVFIDYVKIGNGFAVHPNKINGHGGKITGNLKMLPFRNAKDLSGLYLGCNVWVKFNRLDEEMWSFPDDVFSSWYREQSLSVNTIVNIGSNVELGYMLFLDNKKKFFLDFSGGFGLHYNFLNRRTYVGEMWKMHEPINSYFFIANNQMGGLYPVFNYKVGLGYKL